jgi:hypothetical protein
MQELTSHEHAKQYFISRLEYHDLSIQKDSECCFRIWQKKLHFFRSEDPKKESLTATKSTARWKIG